MPLNGKPSWNKMLNSCSQIVQMSPRNEYGILIACTSVWLLVNLSSSLSGLESVSFFINGTLRWHEAWLHCHDLENGTRRKSENPCSGETSFENVNVRHPGTQLTPYTRDCAACRSSRWLWVCSAHVENANSKGTVDSGVWQWGGWGFKFGGGMVTSATVWCPSTVVFRASSISEASRAQSGLGAEITTETTAHLSSLLTEAFIGDYVFMGRKSPSQLARLLGKAFVWKLGDHIFVFS